jgi:hypothetical protein
MTQIFCHAELFSDHFSDDHEHSLELFIDNRPQTG